jgi:hypothetical protein
MRKRLYSVAQGNAVICDSHGCDKVRRRVLRAVEESISHGRSKRKEKIKRL